MVAACDFVRFSPSCVISGPYLKSLFAKLWFLICFLSIRWIYFSFLFYQSSIRPFFFASLCFCFSLYLFLFSLMTKWSEFMSLGGFLRRKDAQEYFSRASSLAACHCCGLKCTKSFPFLRHQLNIMNGYWWWNGFSSCQNMFFLKKTHKCVSAKCKIQI